MKETTLKAAIAVAMAAATGDYPRRGYVYRLYLGHDGGMD